MPYEYLNIVRCHEQLKTHISVFCFPTSFISSSGFEAAASLTLLRRQVFIHRPAAAARTRQQGQEVNRAGQSASSPLPLTDCCTWVTSWVSGPNSCEWPETDSAACLVLLNIAALPTCTQQFLPILPPFSLSGCMFTARPLFFFSEWLFSDVLGHQYVTSSVTTTTVWYLRIFKHNIWGLKC